MQDPFSVNESLVDQLQQHPTTMERAFKYQKRVYRILTSFINPWGTQGKFFCVFFMLK